MTHQPKHRGCEVCAGAKLAGRKCVGKSVDPDRRSDDSLVAKAKNFGDLITADHLNTHGQEDIEGSDYAVVFKDVATGWIDCHPTASKSTEDAVEALNILVGADEKVKNFYTDAAEELTKAAKQLGWRHPTALPGRPQTNGIAERAVKQVLNGTRAVLKASGLPGKWWSRAARHFCMMQNVCGNSWKSEPSAWELRRGVPFAGKLVPFGAKVEYRPSLPSQRTGERFDPAASNGVLVGYHMNPGGRWSGDYYVLDLKVIEENHDSRLIKARRTGEIIVPQGEFIFPAKEMKCGTKEPPVDDGGAPSNEGLSGSSGSAPSGVNAASAAADDESLAELRGSRPKPTDLSAKSEEVKPTLPKYKAGEFIRTTAFDESRLPKGYEFTNERVTRTMKTRRPPNIAPEFWSFMTPKERDEAARVHRESLVLVEQSTTGSEEPAVICPVKIAADYPTMPRAGEEDRREIDDDLYAYHREKCGQVGARGMALVARPVRPKEVKTNPAAQASLDKEYNALCHELKAWDMNGVREWTAVQNEARKANKRVHVGMIFGICVEKNAELPAGDPNRKYKCRFVFQGNQLGMKKT